MIETLPAVSTNAIRFSYSAATIVSSWSTSNPPRPGSDASSVRRRSVEAVDPVAGADVEAELVVVGDVDDVVQAGDEHAALAGGEVDPDDAVQLPVGDGEPAAVIDSD